MAYKVHVSRGLAERARHEARWARQGIALADALEAASPSEPGDQDAQDPGPAAPPVRAAARVSARD